MLCGCQQVGLSQKKKSPKEKKKEDDENSSGTRFLFVRLIILLIGYFMLQYHSAAICAENYMNRLSCELCPIVPISNHPPSTASGQMIWAGEMFNTYTGSLTQKYIITSVIYAI